MSQSYPDIEELVPHGLPMRIVEELVHWQPGQARCRLQVRAHHPLVQAGKLPGVNLLEVMAQSVAACLGYEAYVGGGRVRVGMIVSVRKLEVNVPSVELGSRLEVSVERIHGTEDVSNFRGRVQLEGRELASGQMTVVHPESPPSASATNSHAPEPSP